VAYGRCDLHPAGQTLWLVDIEGKRDEEILALADLDGYRPPVADGAQLVVLHETIDRARVGLWRLSDRRCSGWSTIQEKRRERALAAGQRRDSRRRSERCRSALQLPIR